MTNNKESKSRQIGIFVGLKILEIGGVFLLSYGLYWLGKFLFNIFNMSCMEWIDKEVCTFWNYWSLGFVSLVVGGVLSSIIIILIIDWIGKNWEWSKEINRKFTTKE